MAKHREFKSSGLQVIKLSNHKVPEFKEVKGVEWVSYGEKNDYPEYLLQLFNRSAKHNAIVTGKAHYIKGAGFVAEKSGNPDVDAKVLAALKNINSDESADDLLYKEVTDNEIFSGYYIDVIPKLDGSGWAELRHIDWSKVRYSKDKGKLWYADKWTDGSGFYKPNAERDGLKELKPFNPKTFSGVIVFTQYRPGMGDYPLPEYIGAIPYIDTDYEIANFHRNNIKNGFSAGTMISFNNGQPDNTEEIKSIEKKIKGRQAGTDNAGEIVIVFSDGKDSAPTIVPLTSNNFDKLFDDLNKTCQEEIFTGHKITSPLLFGIKTEGQLGGNSELITAFELFKNGYVAAKQKMILKTWNYLFELNGWGTPLRIQDIEPISFQLSETALLQVATRDELRQMVNLPMSAQKEEDANKKVLDSINALSPLVANKVLESMTPDEIRALASLGPAIVKAEPVQMSKQLTDDEAIEIFSQFGVPADQYQVKESFEVHDRDEAIIREIKIYQAFDKKDDDLVRGKRSGGESTKDTADVNISVMYSYNVRSDKGPAVIDTTRPFCKKMIELNRLYTREDIKAISAKVGRDVWATRGGFYHDPKLDVTTKFCRHVWKQNIVTKNG